MNAALSNGSGEFEDPADEAAFQAEQLGALARRARLTARWLTGMWLSYGLVEALMLSGSDLALALAVRALCVLPVLPVIGRTYTHPDRLHRDALIGAGGFFVGCVLFIVVNPHPWVDVQAPAWVAFTLMVHTLMELHAWRHLVALNACFAGASLAAWMHRVDASGGDLLAAAFAIGGSLLASVVASAFLNARSRTTHAHLRQSRALEESRSLLLTAVAHELRTPLARFRMGLSLARRTGDPAPLEEADRQLDQLDRLITELVRFGQLVPGERVARQDEVRADELVSDALALAAGRNPGREVELAVPAVPLRVHADLLLSALSNLLINALRHARGRVRVTTTLTSDSLRFQIEDDGPGVPPTHRREIFEPFRRLDAARTRDRGGVGLGLAIVARIAAAHGGRVWVEDADLGGARFVLEVPSDTGIGAAAPPPLDTPLGQP